MKSCVFCSNRIRTLVVIVTYSFHRLIWEKWKFTKKNLSQWEHLDFVLTEMFIG